jgi:hypothetical protein
MRAKSPQAISLDARCASAGKPFGAVAHGGNPQDRAASPTHWLGYTDKAHQGGLQEFLAHLGGLRLYSRTLLGCRVKYLFKIGMLPFITAHQQYQPSPSALGLPLIVKFRDSK